MKTNKNTIKGLVLGATLATGLLGNAALAQTPPAQATAPQTTNVKVFLKGYVFGFRVMKADYQATFTERNYFVRADLKTSGLGALLQKFQIWATTKGQFNGTDLVPREHIQQNLDKKNRRVEMNYGPTSVDVAINPRLGSLGTPPATPAQKFNSDDALSGLLNLMMRGYRTGDQPCQGVVPMFDSKQHYNLRLENAGTKYIRQSGYKGETVKCHVYYEAVSGYDPEDLPNQEEASAPVKLYLANFPEAGMYIPVKMSYKISGFTAVIKARDIDITRY